MIGIFFKWQVGCSTDPKEGRSEAAIWFNCDKVRNATNIINEGTGCYRGISPKGQSQYVQRNKSKNDFWTVVLAR